MQVANHEDEGWEGAHDGGPLRVFAPRRTAWILTLCIVWCGIVCARLAQYMVLQRAHFAALMESEAWQVSDVPALRGRLLDRDGTPLAWSTRHFQVLYEVPPDPGVAAAQMSAIRRAAPAVAPRLDAPAAGAEVVLVHDPLPETLAVLNELAARMDELHVRSYTRRNTISDPRLRRRLGTVQIVDGRICGVNGEEKRHDHLLRGTAGKYRVMVDREGAWIPGTWETLRELRPGYDVYLNVRVSPRN